MVKNEAVKIHLSNITIGKMEPDDIIRPLQAAILMVAQRLGLKVGAIEVQDICRFTCQYYKDLAIEEIPLAFEMLSAQKFEIKSGGHFGLLSQTYWGEVLTSYRRYRIEETRKANLLKVENIELTPEEVEVKNKQAMSQGVLESWEYFKEKKKMEYEPVLDIMGGMYYDFLRAENIMLKPNDLELETIKNETEKYLQNELKNQQYNANRSEFKNLGEQIKNVRNISNFQTICKKIALRKYFENLVLTETDLKTLVIKTT